MPAKTEKQKKFMEVVRGTQKGEVKNPSEKAKKAAKEMTKKEVDEFAKGKVKK